MNEQYNIPPLQPAMPVMPHNSTLAIVSLISGIAGWFLLPLIAAVVAVITGHMAKNEIKKSGGMVTGNGMATAGMILGYVQLGLIVCGCIVWAGFMIYAAITGSSSNIY